MAPRKMPWLRLWCSFLDDTKIQIMSEKDQRRYLMLLILRRRNLLKSMTEKEIALALRITDEEWGETFENLQRKQLVTSKQEIVGWKKFQRKSDNSTERSAKSRARKAIDSDGCNSDATVYQRCKHDARKKSIDLRRKKESIADFSNKLKLLFKEIGAKWKISKEIGGDAADRGIRRYCTTDERKAKAVKALNMILEREPSRFHTKNDYGYWSLDWLFRLRTSGKEPKDVDRINEILIGNMFEDKISGGEMSDKDRASVKKYGRLVRAPEVLFELPWGSKMNEIEKAHLAAYRTKNDV